MRCTMYCRTSWRCTHESHALLLCRALNSFELLLGLASEAGTTCSSVGAGGRLSFYTSSAELLELCSEPFKRCRAYPTRLLVDCFARLSVGKRRSPFLSCHSPILYTSHNSMSNSPLSTSTLAIGSLVSLFEGELSLSQ
jgi:hypothetical protein